MSGWRTPHWLASSVRNKLLAMALLPLLVAFPLLVLALAVWSNQAYDRLLITKVRSDLAVAQGYFDQVLIEVGSGTLGVADSRALADALRPGTPEARAQLSAHLAAERERLGLDFLVLYDAAGRPIARGAPPGLSLEDQRAGQQPLPAALANTVQTQRERAKARLLILDNLALRAMVPHLSSRTSIALVPTRNAAPTQRQTEDRAMVAQATLPVMDAQGRRLGVLSGGLLLNQNLDFIDHINRIVYPAGSLPFDSQGTATLFLEDVRITTNVRLFQDRRAIGTRVSQAVRNTVLGEGRTWLDLAFVVNDWYVSAYEPLTDAQGQRVGMLYVGFTEQPFRLMRYAMLALIGLIFGGVMAASAWFSLRWARSIFEPVQQMNLTMQRVEQGDGAARVGELQARDELGSLAGHLDQLLDVIADKTEALQRWADELDRKVAERTQELQASNASLKLAQEQLVKSEKLAAIGQLTASIAHEINNPIAVMQGNLDLMRDTLGPRADAVRGELALLDQQIERMRIIVTQLLQYARPTEYAGYIDALDLNRTVEDCLVLVSHLLAKTGITIERDLRATHRVGINRQELQQVIINLLINAIQAMPDGGALRLSTRDSEAGAELRVIDSGSGFPPAALERLFRPFFTTKNDGNGLGLWISQGLVERYGGQISAANRSDGPRGAVLAVSLYTEPQAPQAAATGNGRPGAR